MTFNFESLLQASKQIDITKAFEDTSAKKGFESDPRYFKLRRKDEVGRATVRFLPNLQGKLPFAKLYSRFVEVDKSAKKYFVANDRETLGDEKDPAQEFHKALWNKYNETKDESWMNFAKKLRRRERYISLMYVVKDANDTTELTQTGLNYLYDYGPEIFTKFTEARKVEDEFGQKLTPVNPFSVGDDGADFGILLKTEGEGTKAMPRYTGSKFLDKGGLFGGDQSALKNMFEMNKDRFYDIHAEVAEDKFESYDEIVKRLIVAFGDTYTNLMGKKAIESDKKIEQQVAEPVKTSTVSSLTEELNSKPTEKVATKSDPELDDLAAFFAGN